MSINRSGYYKWLARKDVPNRYEQDRKILTELLLEQHNKHKTKGYHYLANLVRNETGWIFSDNLVHKCCKLAGIRSKTKRGRKIAGRENIKFPNIIKGNWNVTKPLEIVVSDMTCIKHKGILWEWTYLLDVFNNEIIASSVTNKVGSSLPYYHCFAINNIFQSEKLAVNEKTIYICLLNEPSPCFLFVYHQPSEFTLWYFNINHIGLLDC